MDPKHWLFLKERLFIITHKVPFRRYLITYNGNQKISAYDPFNFYADPVPDPGSALEKNGSGDPDPGNFFKIY